MAAPAIIAAGISGIASLGSAIFGGGARKKADKRAFDNQVKMFNMTNEYNTPLNQRKRLVEGGFNPALMYGGGGISQTASTPRAPEVNPDNTASNALMALPQAVQAYFDYTMMDKQKELIDANIASRNQSVATSQADLRLKEFQLDKLYPATHADLVQRTSNAFSSNQRAETLFPGSLQIQQDTIQKNALERDLLVERIEGEGLNNVRKEIENANLDARLKMQLQELTSRVANLAADAKIKGEVLTAKQVENLINEEFTDMAKRGFTKSDPFYVRFTAKVGDMISKVLNKSFNLKN